MEIRYILALAANAIDPHLKVNQQSRLGALKVGGSEGIVRSSDQRKASLNKSVCRFGRDGQ